MGSLDMLVGDGEVRGAPSYWPKEVAVPMNWGGRSSHALLKFRPSPKEGIVY